jgi:hypothetical protein
MITRSHIENIRKSVKQEGDYKPTAEIIRTAILNVCPNMENVLQYKKEIVQEIIKMQSGELIPLNQEEITSEAEIQDSVDTSLTKNQPAEINSSETSLVVSEQEKQVLVMQQAQEMGIQLSQAEVITIAESAEINSSTIAEYIQEVEPAIKAFIQFKELEDSNKIDRFVTNIRKEMSCSNKRVQTKLETGLKEVQADLGGVRTSWKRAKELTLERFRIPVNS